MPSVIDYILQVTKKEKVDIIGHSLGATSALIMCSTQPEYNEKVRSLIAIAPGVFFNSSSQSNVQQILKRYEPYLKVRLYRRFPRKSSSFNKARQFYFINNFDSVSVFAFTTWSKRVFLQKRCDKTSIESDVQRVFSITSLMHILLAKYSRIFQHHEATSCKYKSQPKPIENLKLPKKYKIKYSMSLIRRSFPRDRSSPSPPKQKRWKTLKIWHFLQNYCPPPSKNAALI